MIASMSQKTAQLQIRVSPSEKAALKRLARQSGQGLSEYVLARALPSDAARIPALIREAADEAQRPYALAELNDWLTQCSALELTEVGRRLEVASLPPLWQNYVAALFEQAAALKQSDPPAWTRRVVPLDEPYFATPLKSLRPHLLRASPVPFKRRNLFVDSAIGARV